MNKPILLTHKTKHHIILYKINGVKYYLYTGIMEQFIDDFKCIKHKYEGEIENDPIEFPKDLYDIKLMQYIPDTLEFIEYFKSEYPSVYSIKEASIDFSTIENPDARKIVGFELNIIYPDFDYDDLHNDLDVTETQWRKKYHKVTLTF